MPHCYKPCKVCKMKVCVLIETKRDSRQISSVVNHMVEESIDDDISFIFRIDGVDQMVKCSGRKANVESYDDCLF